MPRLQNKLQGPKAPALYSYDGLLVDIARVIEDARHLAARSVNAVMTTTYWLVGQRIVEQEQRGAPRAGYGETLLKRLARDLSKRFGRGFSERNLEQMRGFYLAWPIPQTASAKSLLPPGAGRRDISQTAPAKYLDAPLPRFQLPWSEGLPNKILAAEYRTTLPDEETIAADGAVVFLERLSPVLEHVDSSSGTIGTAVNNAIAELISVIAAAPADPQTREAWLERLWDAHEADQIPYIERLADYWAELCASEQARRARSRRGEAGLRGGRRHARATVARSGIRVRDHRR